MVIGKHEHVETQQLKRIGTDFWLFSLPSPSENASTSPASCQSPDPPMTLGEFDLLREHLCFDLENVGLHTLYSNNNILFSSQY